MDVRGYNDTDVMEITVNNSDWGRVDQVSRPFSVSRDERPPSSNFTTVFSESWGVVTQYTAVPNAGYRFLNWTNIKAEVHKQIEDRKKKDGSVYYTFDQTYNRSRTSSDVNPLGYSFAETSAWNATLWPPPSRDGFTTPPHEIGFRSNNHSFADQNYNPDTDSEGDTYITWTPVSLQANFTPIQVAVRLKYRMRGDAGDVIVATLGAQDAGSQLTIPTQLYTIPQSGDSSFAGTNWAWNRHWKDETTGTVYKLGDVMTLPKPVYSGENTVYIDLYAVFRQCTMLPMYLPSTGLLLHGTSRRRQYIIRDGDPLS